VTDLVNGDDVRILTGPAAGLTGIVGATREDGQVEVIMPDLMGPASEAEQFYHEGNLRLTGRQEIGA
jgi:hypothetical protein